MTIVFVHQHENVAFFTRRRRSIFSRKMDLLRLVLARQPLERLRFLPKLVRSNVFVNHRISTLNQRLSPPTTSYTDTCTRNGEMSALSVQLIGREKALGRAAFLRDEGMFRYFLSIPKFGFDFSVYWYYLSTDNIQIQRLVFEKAETEGLYFDDFVDFAFHLSAITWTEESRAIFAPLVRKAASELVEEYGGDVDYLPPKNDLSVFSAVAGFIAPDLEDTDFYEILREDDGCRSSFYLGRIMAITGGEWVLTYDSVLNELYLKVGRGYDDRYDDFVRLYLENLKIRCGYLYPLIEEWRGYYGGEPDDDIFQGMIKLAIRTGCLPLLEIYSESPDFMSNLFEATSGIHLALMDSKSMRNVDHILERFGHAMNPMFIQEFNRAVTEEHEGYIKRGALPR